MCGENEIKFTENEDGEGSPPRVRGKPDAACSIERLIRITPACAGKTAIVIKPLPRKQDHPRVCGENTWAVGRL